jgi:hypothetical protein
VHWIFDPGLLTPVAGTACANGKDLVIADDTAGTELTCSVTNLLSGTLTQTATVRVDQTPPAVAGAVPARPPDHNGWYNHPVAFGFTGSDATSGVAGCDSVTYGGPDSPAAQVAGACHDVAGNSSTGTAPLKYDATPPTITAIPQNSNDGEVRLKWSGSPDAVEYSVTRSPGHDDEPSSTVYTGPSQSFTDNSVTEAETYTYAISASDAAANSSVVVIVATPGGAQTVSPGKLTTDSRRLLPSTLPRLRWRRVAHADYYNVQVYRGHRKVLSAWPAGTHLQLRPTWRFRGKRFLLTPGRYHWYAWPGYGRRRAHQYGRMITHKQFTVKRPGRASQTRLAAAEATRSS